MYFYCIFGKEGDIRVLLFRHLPSRSFLVSRLIFNSSIHFVFTFVNDVKELSSLILLHVAV